MSACSHGRTGFCFDDATPEERRAFEAAHRAAHAFLAPSDGNAAHRDEAERFAGWFAGREYGRGDAWPEGVDLRREHERFRKANRLTVRK